MNINKLDHLASIMEKANVICRHSDHHVWYFAYGSNMSSKKFSSRGIVPLASARVRIPGWILACNIPGLPYSEPSFTSIVPRNSTLQGRHSSIQSDPDVLGVAYLLTRKQYALVLGSEGGGTAYEDIEVDAIPIDLEDGQLTGPKVSVKTLGTAIERKPWPKTSKRYMVNYPDLNW